MARLVRCSTRGDTAPIGSLADRDADRDAHSLSNILSLFCRSLFLSLRCALRLRLRLPSAYFSPYQMWDRRRRVIPPEEAAKSLLLSGWLACPLPLQREEIEHSFMRLGIAENEKSYATFVGHSRQEVAQQLRQNVPDDWIPEMHPHWLEERNKGRLHIRLLCLRIVEDAVASVKYPILSYLAMGMALVHCMIPQVRRAGGRRGAWGLERLCDSGANRGCGCACCPLCFFLANPFLP